MNRVPKRARRLRASRSGVWGALTAVSLLLAGTSVQSAELNSIETIVSQQCAQLQATGGDMARYEAWIAAVKREAINEFEIAAKEILRHSETWLALKEEHLDAQQELEEQQRYATLVTGIANQMDQIDELTLEIVDLDNKLEKTADPKEKQKLQDRKAKLETAYSEQYGYLIAAWESKELKDARKYFRFTGSPFGDDVYSLKEEMLGDEFRSDMHDKETAVKRRVDTLAAKKKKSEKEFEQAHENYEQARLMLGAIDAIDERIRKCAPGQSGIAGTLTATWMVVYLYPTNPNNRWCHSGRLIIEFDDAGQTRSTDITVDCTTSDIRMKSGGPWSRSSTSCPAPVRNWGEKLSIANVRADISSGQITAEVHHQDVSDVGALTGTFQRSAQPPYGYSGKGSMRFPSDTPANRVNPDWQSSPALKCQ